MRFGFRLLLLPLVLLAVLAPLPQAARANVQKYAYYWSALFPFQSDFNGVLTIQVGPWENGQLTSVDATSHVPVSCVPIGNVTLSGGDAVFNGGYLRCTMNIRAAVLANHGRLIPAVDTYQNMFFAANLQTNVAKHAPIFTHGDAVYTVDFTNPNQVRLTQDLENDLGVQQGVFPGNGIIRRTYEMRYTCAWLGACNSHFRVGLQSQVTPAGGVPLSFTTGWQSFMIGGDGVTTFWGRMGSLEIDPGNTVQ